MLTLTLLLLLALDPATLVFLSMDAGEAPRPYAAHGGSVESPAPVAPVTVRVSGVRGDEGQALVAFFQSDDGFPRDLDRAALVVSAPIRDGRALAEADVEPGRYVIVAVHDADGDGAMGTNWLGMPSEGVAVSNWDGGRPRFASSVVDVGSGAPVELALRYR